MSPMVQSFVRYERHCHSAESPSAEESETTQSSKQNTHSNFPLPSGLNLPHQRVIKMHAARPGPAPD